MFQAVPYNSVEWNMFYPDLKDFESKNMTYPEGKISIYMYMYNVWILKVDNCTHLPHDQIRR